MYTKRAKSRRDGGSASLSAESFDRFAGIIITKLNAKKTWSLPSKQAVAGLDPLPIHPSGASHF